MELDALSLNTEFTVTVFTVQLPGLSIGKVLMRK